MPRPSPANYGLLYESVYGVSPEVSITVAAPEIACIVTITVRETLTKKPVEGATITTDVGVTGTTDATGTAILTLSGGERTFIVSKSGYWTKTLKQLITKDTTLEISLVPTWMIVAGGAGAFLTLLGVGLVLTRK